jgi:hypothetical protein
MPEIPISTQLDRFHVPLIVYSPLLKKAGHFKSISSHFDIAPSIIAFLKENYNMIFPSLSAWIGHGLDTGSVFRNLHPIPLMRNKSEFIDFIEDDELLSANTLYKIYPTMDIEAIENENKLEQLLEHFEIFKSKNALVCRNNKLIPDSLLKK